MSKDLQELLESLVGKIDEIDKKQEQHELIRKLVISWGLTPSQAIQLLLEAAIVMGVDAKKDDTPDAEVYDMLIGLFGRKVEQARKSLGLLEKLRKEYEAMQADDKKPGHA